MKVFRNIFLLTSLICIGCKEENTSNQDVYDFMKIVIKEQQLDKNYAVRITPESRLSISDSDSITFNKVLFEIQQKEQQKNNKNDDDDPLDLEEILSTPMSDVYYLDNFTKEDIAYMKQQKKELDNFKWDNARLGFNQTNEKDWYAFSVPLFSKDRTKAVMMLKDLCPGLCGSGQTIVFTKKDGKWSSVMGNFWFH